ncbi:unnamed protein product [Brassicogethes aeneus]|uniref:CHHC U11-48K-type domain-containing protein n=1 Tax=Brassicogethes aeneus TaxID=1431903 RepID=A0A9P0FLN4_BRAAE|nr:unnamed protein product [Brassicogethes aeneus]
MFDPIEEKKICPYDRSHNILASRMAVHITKCKKNFPNMRVATCDFNVTHKIPIPELQYHHEICCDRRVAEVIICGTQDYNPNKFPVIDNTVALGDDWSNEIGTSTYDPTSHLEKNEILRRKDVEPPSVRKNFKHEERHRISQITGNTSEPVQSSSQERVQLPETKNAVKITEETPEEVTQILQRIKDGSKQAFIPK